MLSFTLRSKTRSVTFGARTHTRMRTHTHTHKLGEQPLCELLISLLGKDKSKYKVPFIHPICFSSSASLAGSVYFAALTLC